VHPGVDGDDLLFSTDRWSFAANAKVFS
jgi:hypothetical protein